MTMTGIRDSTGVLWPGIPIAGPGITLSQDATGQTIINAGDVIGVADEAARLALDVKRGQWVLQDDNGKNYIFVGALGVDGPGADPADDDPANEDHWREAAHGYAKLYSITFGFGDGITAAPDGAMCIVTVPIDGKIIAWVARLDVSGSATFAVAHAAGITGAFSSVGGTDPDVSGAVGDFDIALDWSTVDVEGGDSIRVTQSSITTATLAALTLLIERA